MEKIQDIEHKEVYNSLDNFVKRIMNQNITN